MTMSPNPAGQRRASGDRTPVRVAQLGCGVVGGAVARLLVARGDELSARVGAPLDLVGIAVRRPDVVREGIDPALFTTDAPALVARDDVDIVVEVIGGIEPARTLILAALESGKSVVTANKALLAEDGATLYAAAEANNVDLYYEAAVAGAIPIVRPLRESLVGDEINAVIGIVNGTTNFILDKMHAEKSGFDDVLAEAQALGYAEADPTADVEGFDAAAKAAILAGLAFHTDVAALDVYREGITEVTSSDIAAAEEMGHVVKLLAICRLAGDRVSARVHPAMIPAEHPLATVGGAFNAVFVESASAGELMFYGPGAGGEPTAAAVLGDLVTVARHRIAGSTGPKRTTHSNRQAIAIGDIETRYFINVEVNDRPGVLAALATRFAEHGVSVQTLRQVSSISNRPDTARLVVVTHRAKESALAATVAAIKELPDVHEVLSFMRVEA
ncbi:homoserine dehydrogenase [Granulicoccus phenolivorans]|uniref:homoserine dehydrogenase n=1 Tax=Granulicoccus phenolivorans TaxID=266854 RepID=UPI000416A304|nr:homoserine dehydrogenase [Granulicoccus phenolivorans]